MGSLLLPCAPPGCPRSRRGGLLGAAPRGQSWTSVVTLPPGRTGLIAWRMAVLSMFREPSLGRHVHRELLRSVLLDVTPTISATACHQRNYVETYSRFKAVEKKGLQGGKGDNNWVVRHRQI